MYLDASQNPSGQTLFNTGGLSWLQFAGLSLSPIRANGSTTVTTRVPNLLRSTRLELGGYVFQNFSTPFWPFSSYTESQGRLAGWEFNGNTTEGWTFANLANSVVQNGTWTLTAEQIDPRLVSPAITIQASESPFIDVQLRCADGATACSGQTLQVFWQTQANPSFAESRFVTYSLLNPDQVSDPNTIVTYAIPVLDNPEWTGTITRLRMDPVSNGAPGREVGIDRIVMAYDARFSETNAKFILAGASHYFSTGDESFFTNPLTPEGTRFDRARIAMNYLQTEMGGNLNNFMALQDSEWVTASG